MKGNKDKSNIGELQKEIENKLNEFRNQTNKIQNEFENTIINLSKKGYKIDKEKIKFVVFDFQLPQVLYN